MYLDEALYYLSEIRRMRLSSYLMDIAITTVPHLKDESRKAFIANIENQLKSMGENDMIDTEPEEGAFDKLRSLLGSKSK